MKKVLNIIAWIIVGIVVLGILLFGLATFMAGSYIQTFFLLLTATVLVYWPAGIRSKTGRGKSLVTRLLLIAVLFAGQFVFFKSGPKKSIYLSDTNRDKLMAAYNRNTTRWPGDTRDILVDTAYGKVHVLSCGDTGKPPLLMIHAASMGAHSWQENLDVLMNHYCIYSVDNIGEGNKSVLTDAQVYPKNQEEIADHLAVIADSLGIERSPVFGASNGGYVAMCYAIYYPERVDSMALFAPMGLTRLTGGSIMMLSVASMYPFEFIYDRVTTWALGDSPNVRSAYGDWFRTILEGTIPSVAMPVPMTTEQKRSMRMPVLLFLGTDDAIVGDAEVASKSASEYPDIRIEVLDSGHLVGVECADAVNPIISDFLDL